MTQNFVITQPNLRNDAPGRALRVLLVDDDRDFVLSLAALLRTEGYDTRSAHDAIRILQDVREYDPDVALLDIAMPGKNGWDAAQELRAGFPGKRPMLVGISGEYTQGGMRAFSQSRGFDFYLMKPCDPSVLLTLLRWVAIESPYRSVLR